MNLKIDVKPISDQISIIVLEGEVDVYTAPQLKQQIIKILDEGKKKIIVNLEAVEYLDSTALGVLIGGLKRLREREGSLDLICTNNRMKRIFEITGLDRIFNILASEAEALSSTGGK
ncbi:MAG: STAS domain-containing protein [Armatimonadota bacterium]